MKIEKLDLASELPYFGWTHAIIEEDGEPLALTGSEEDAKKLLDPKMNDHQKLVELFGRWDMAFENEHYPEGYKYPPREAPEVPIHYVVTLSEGCGYFGFAAVFFFDKDGKFLLHGVWE